MSEAFFSHFTPSLMTHETLEAVFVQRHEVIERLLTSVRDSVLTAGKKHSLVIGPRGIGKTHLLSLVYYRLKQMEDLKRRMVIAWLREEEWSIASLRDFFLCVIRAIEQEEPDPERAKRVAALTDLAPDAVEHEAGNILRETCKGRTLVILAENANDIFTSLEDIGQKGLRAYIQNYDFIALLFSATSLFEGVSLQTAPFYGFFRVETLYPLTIDEAVTLITNIATERNDIELAKLMKTPLGRSRVRAVNAFARGNHRVFVIFSQFLNRKTLDELVQPFMRMIDELTPYYQSCLSQRAPLQRRIIEVMCERARPLSVAEIAKYIFSTSQTVSGQLKKLREDGFVVFTQEGRESYYELREPLMRLCIDVKKNRGEPIRMMVEFFRLVYSPDQLKDRLSRLPSDARLERSYIQHALRFEQEGAPNPLVAACLSDLKKYREDGDIENQLKIVEELEQIRKHTPDKIVKAILLVKKGLFEDAMSQIEEIKNDSGFDSSGLNAVRFIFMKIAGDQMSSRNFVHGLQILDRAIQVFPNDVDLLEGRALCLVGLMRFEEVVKVTECLLELDPKHSHGWLMRGLALARLESIDLAIESLQKSVEIDPKNGDAWLILGDIFTMRKNRLEAVKSYENFLASTPFELRKSSLQYASALYELDRFDEASGTVNEYLVTNPKDSAALYLKALIAKERDNLDEAIGAIENAISIVHDDVRYLQLAVQISIALNRFEDALKWITKELSIDPKDGIGWIIKAQLLMNMGMLEDALGAARKSLELNPADQECLMIISAACAATGRWKECLSSLEEVVKHSVPEGISQCLEVILASCFIGPKFERFAIEIWKIADRAQAYAELASALAACLSVVKHPDFSIGRAQNWLGFWKKLAGNRTEFERTLRLISAAIRLRNPNDQKALIELPVEERELLLELLAKSRIEVKADRSNSTPLSNEGNDAT